MSEPTLPPNVSQIAGPLLLGYLFNWGLFGALTVQVYIYYVAFPKDNRVFKVIVYGVYVFELLQTILATHDVFGSLGSGWGNMSALLAIQTSWFNVPVMSGIISCTTQTFFAWRIYCLSKLKILSLVIIILAITEAAGGIVTGAQAKEDKSFSDLQSTEFVSTTIWLAGSALCDIVIAISMVYYLYKSRTGYISTNIVITKLIRLTIETGLLTASVATVDIVLFLSFRHNNYHVTPALTLAKLYSNSLLVIFNSRVRMRGGRNEREVVTGVSGTLDFQITSNTTSTAGSSGGQVLQLNSKSKGGHPGVNVEISTEFTGDYGSSINMAPLKLPKERASFESDSNATESKIQRPADFERLPDQ